MRSVRAFCCNYSGLQFCNFWLQVITMSAPITPNIRPLSSSYTFKDSSSPLSPRPPKSAREKSSPDTAEYYTPLSARLYNNNNGNNEGRTPLLSFASMPAKLHTLKLEKLNEKHEEQRETSNLAFLTTLPKAKNKFVELGHHMNEIDKEIMRQNAVRKKRQVQVSNLEQKHDVVLDNVGSLQGSVDKIEDRVTRVEASKFNTTKNSSIYTETLNSN
jgi:hypothetical protein